MKRYEAIKEIAKILQDELVVCNLGVPSKEFFNAKDRPENFYMMGSMGLASSIALGLALARPDKKIWCIEGDGALLMNLGSLCTIANLNPKNMTLIVIDNGVYGSTGGQKTHTSQATRLEQVAIGAGFKSSVVISSQEQIVPILEQGSDDCRFVLIKTEPGNSTVKNIPLSPVAIKERFKRSIE
ncbi:MAG: sulfopyruvate decarboxylase subunit beta [Candidatus Lokiarchaeota archaeon]|nr:sulfopyruvate decarboxylase subunit beta [Candidatus Lokiarchaeota archaeon]